MDRPCHHAVVLGLRELQRWLCLMFNGQGHSLSRARRIWLWAPSPSQACCVTLSLSLWFSESHSPSAKMETVVFLYLTVGSPFISLGMFSLSSYKSCQDKTWGFLYAFPLWLSGALVADPAMLLVIWQPWSCRWLNSSPQHTCWAAILPTHRTSDECQVYILYKRH